MVNLMDVQAGARSISLLAWRQPMGRDLRVIISLGKLVTDLERIGDEARRNARVVMPLLNTPSVHPLFDLPRAAKSMASVAGMKFSQSMATTSNTFRLAT
ncbi:MAG: phosphate transport system protein [Gammaproteobacteria bacterium]|jgi:phosphate transport system protein